MPSTVKKLVFFVFLVIVTSCSQTATAPTPTLPPCPYGKHPCSTTYEIETKPVSQISSTSATSGGWITIFCYNSCNDPTQYGVCWSTHSAPTISDHISDGTNATWSGALSFTSNLGGLTPSTTYYVKSFYKNPGNGLVAYGGEESFTTLP